MKVLTEHSVVYCWNIRMGDCIFYKLAKTSQDSVCKVFPIEGELDNQDGGGCKG